MIFLLMLSPVLSLRTLTGCCLEAGTPKLGGHAQSEMTVESSAVHTTDLKAMVADANCASQEQTKTRSLTEGFGSRFVDSSKVES